ncbi:MAG: ATP-binding protein [Sulfolobales archaeon]
MSQRGVIGYVTQSYSPILAEAVSDTPVPIGSYVYAEFDVRDRATGSLITRRVIGVVTNAGYQPAMPLSTLALLREDTDPSKIKTPKYSPMNIYVIADVSEREPSSPLYPIPPNTPIYLVSSIQPSPLEKVYKRPDLFNGLIRIGSLARLENIDVAIDVNKLHKHLLITGATGSGKSNAVAIIADRLSMLGAPVIIFDVHGEYVNLEPEDGRVDKIEVIRAEIDPLNINLEALTHMIIRDPQATRQRRLFRKLMRSLIKQLRKIAQDKNIDPKLAIEDLFQSLLKTQQSRVLDLADDYFGTDQIDQVIKMDYTKKFILLIASKISSLVDQSDSRSRSTLEGLEERFLDFVWSYPILNLDAIDPLSKISPGKIIVYDVSMLTDDQKAWLLRLLADNLLENLKNRYRSRQILPTVLVVEEAPLFISAYSSSVAKESLRRFAREGRKFGGVLIIASQRPRTLDPDISSQIQNFLFLKLVQQEDIKSVMSIADNLEESLARTLPSLPTGWGIVMGEWIGRFPALVAVDKHKGKRLGASPDFVSEWRKGLESIEKKDLRPSEFSF